MLFRSLARHYNGTFKLIAAEDPAAFEALKQSLLNEHVPATETESILVLNMAESHWLARRAGRLLESTSLDPNSGVITNEKPFSSSPNHPHPRVPQMSQPTF